MLKLYVCIFLVTIHLSNISMHQDHSRPVFEEAKQLIATNAEVKNWTHLESLIRNNCDPKIIEQLLKRGVNPNNLTVAANILSIEHTRLLLRYGANSNYQNASRETRQI